MAVDPKTVPWWESGGIAHTVAVRMEPGWIYTACGLLCTGSATCASAGTRRLCRACVAALRTATACRATAGEGGAK